MLILQKKNLDQSEASFQLLVWASTMQAGLWLVQIFFLQNWHPWPILRLKSRVQKSCTGVISDFFPQKMDFWAYTHQFFSMGLLETFHNEDFWRENFWYRCRWEVTVSKCPILKCLFLIGGGHQVNDQHGPATGMARAFRNGITLDGRPKNKRVRAYLVKL